jgi:autotransporter translocation and assembly factor TamB
VPAYAKVRAFVGHRRTRLARRVLRRTVATCAVILAVAVVTTVTVDLGPAAKSYAESYGSQYLERPLRIGRISFRLWTGRFLFEDLRIDGISPSARPFLEAKRIELAVPWSTLFNRRFVISAIDMSDWRVFIETRDDGGRVLPRFTRERSGPRTSDWTTTLEWVRAHRGHLEYEDHGTPWRIVAPNMEITVAKPGSEYRGTATFSEGTITIQNYLPFRADMDATFKLDGSRVVMDRAELVTDGARSRIHGDVNLSHWPEQMFRIESTIDFERMRQIFFARERFRLTGTGEFEGYFHLFKEPANDGRPSRTGRELKGTFQSPHAGVDAGGDAYRFDDLRGFVRWTPERLAVTEASAAAYGGRAQFEYEMAPLGRGVRPTARFNTRYQDMSLRRLTEFFQLDGMRLDGAASGRTNFTWPLGRFAERRIEGDLRVAPPSGVTLMTRQVPVDLIEQGRLPRGPATRLEPLIPLPIGGAVTYDITPRTIRIGSSHVATQRSYVEFSGETTPGGEGSTIPFFASSADWQESYKVFAAMRTALGSRTATIDIGGYGTFDGVLTGSLKRPRIEGTFAAERMRAWDVEWGSARGRAAIENSYADIAETTITSGASTITADGRFSLGFPRADGGEELNARIRLTNRPVADLREAFGLERYPIDGLLSGDFRVFGPYRRPFGYGTMELSEAKVYGETLESATATLNLEGTGARLTAIDIVKGGGRGRGAAYVGWDSTYSFDFSAEAIPIESVSLAARVPENFALSGLVDFKATGSGTFDMPRYTVKGTIRDLFAGDEGIGQVVGEIGIIGDTMSIMADVASPRLAVGVNGRMELTDAMYTDVNFTFTDTSLDPYVRRFNPRFSPFTTAIVSGGVHVEGELANPDALTIEAQVDRLDLQLFDYALRNEAPFTIGFDRNAVTINNTVCDPAQEDCRALVLNGEGTNLRLSGLVSLGDDERIDIRGFGDANLAVLQGIVPNIFSRGHAILSARVGGSRSEPVITGTLTAENGRIRHFDAPHAIENINGPIAFDSSGVTLDGLRASLGGGPVQFGGRIDMDGFLPGQLGVTLTGQNMRVRFPEQMQSTVDASLTLQGTIDNMRLGGDVTVKDALYARPFPSNIFYFIDNEASRPAAPGPTLPLTFDGIRVVANSSIRVQNRGDISARLTASADLELRGTYDRPVLFGDVEIDRGSELTLFGRRHVVTQGTVIFNNPSRIEPTFDLVTETRVRVPGETYQITSAVRGVCCERLIFDFTSDPSLPPAEIAALLLSDVAPSGNPELVRLYRADNDLASQQQFIQELLTRQATGVVSSRVSGAIERAFGVDQVSIAPSFTDPNQQSSRLDPAIRLVLMKKLSPRAYLTYSRSLSSSTQDEIVLIEYDQTDRTSWILSRNEDQTYALEFRMRRAFGN